MLRQSRFGQFFVFLCGGVLSAVVDIGLMQLALMQGAGPFLASTLGFAAGLLINFAFHARVTFKRLAGADTLVRYLCVVGLNYLITLAMVALAVHWVGVALWGKLASLPLVAVNGYFLSKYWIFK